MKKTTNNNQLFFTNTKETYNFFKNISRPSWTFKWFWKDIWRKISCQICPRQKWLNKYIPKEYSDKDYLLEKILDGIIIEFIETEKCFEVTDWNHNSHVRKKGKKLKEIYQWIKVGRKKEYFKISELYNLCPPYSATKDSKSLFDCHNKNYRYSYDKIQKLEDKIEFKDTQYYSWIIKNRGLLWT